MRLRILTIALILTFQSCKLSKQKCSCNNNLPSYCVKKIKTKQLESVIEGRIMKGSIPVFKSSVQVISINPDSLSTDTLVTYTDSLGMFKLRIKKGEYQIRVYNNDFFSKKIKKLKVSSNQKIKINFCVVNHSEGMY